MLLGDVYEHCRVSYRTLITLRYFKAADHFLPKAHKITLILVRISDALKPLITYSEMLSDH